MSAKSHLHRKEQGSREEAAKLEASRGSLASAYRRAKHVGIEAVVIAELKLYDVESHVFAAHLVERTERSDDSAPNMEYRPKRTHRVTAGLDPAVLGDIRLVRSRGEAPLLSSRSRRRSKIACAREIALDPLGRHCFGIQAEPVADELVPRKKNCPKIEIVDVENNLCVGDASSHVRIAFTRSLETKVPS
jgi:hypothetical protein